MFKIEILFFKSIHRTLETVFRSLLTITGEHSRAAAPDHAALSGSWQLTSWTLSVTLLRQTPPSPVVNLRVRHFASICVSSFFHRRSEVVYPGDRLPSSDHSVSMNAWGCGSIALQRVFTQTVAFRPKLVHACVSSNIVMAVFRRNEQCEASEARWR